MSSPVTVEEMQLSIDTEGVGGESLISHSYTFTHTLVHPFLHACRYGVRGESGR